MCKDKNALVLENHRFRKNTEEKMEKFMSEALKDLVEKGFKM